MTEAQHETFPIMAQAYAFNEKHYACRNSRCGIDLQVVELKCFTNLLCTVSSNLSRARLLPFQYFHSLSRALEYSVPSCYGAAQVVWLACW